MPCATICSSPANWSPRRARSPSPKELGLELPLRLTRLLELLERGQIEVNINMAPVRAFLGQMQKMTNRLALAMLLAAVITALSLILVVYHPATWQSMGEIVFGLATRVRGASPMLVHRQKKSGDGMRAARASHPHPNGEE